MKTLLYLLLVTGRGMMLSIPAGPPDAPLDVQLEHGPSPGIALISWLPVTIDAAGTSNGVRVTGYTIYADKKKARTCCFFCRTLTLLSTKQHCSLISVYICLSVAFCKLVYFFIMSI